MEHAPNEGPINSAQALAELRTIVAQVIGVPEAEIDPRQRFLDLGASSLVMVDAFRRVHEVLGVRPSIRAVFEHHDTLEKLAAYVAELVATQKPADQARRQERERERAARAAAERSALQELPLSRSQEHVGFVSRWVEGAVGAFNEMEVLELSGAIHLETLEAALRRVTERHEALRTVVDLEGDRQRILASFTPRLERVTRGEEADATARWLKEARDRAFDLSQPLWSASLLELSADRSLLVLAGHGLIMDRAGLQTLAAELAEIYSATREGRPPRLDPAASLESWLDQAAADAETDSARASDFWLARLSGALPRLDLPADHPRPPFKTYRGARLVVPLEAELSAALEKLGRAQGTGTYAVMLAAYQVWLARMSDEDDVVVGIFSSGNDRQTAAARIAVETNPLALRARLARDVRFTDHLRAMHQDLLAAYDFQSYPFATLIQALKPARDPSRSPIFSAAFDRELSRPTPVFSGLASARLTAPSSHCRYDLMLTLVEARDGAQLVVDYSTDLFERESMKRMMRHFLTLLRGIAEDASRTVASLPLLTREERGQVLALGRGPRRPYEGRGSVHGLIEQQVRRTPDRLAVTFEDQALTYAALDRAANRFAASLLAKGVQPGDRVGVALERSIDLVPALLGVLKAGAAYVPIDPSYPAERSAFMLEDAGARALIADAPHSALAAVVRDVLSPVSILAASGEPKIETSDAPDALAYVIYTSGSTGAPKGVEVTHRGVVNVLTSLAKTLPLTEDDVILATTTIAFDIAVAELFLPLIAGARTDVGARDLATDGTKLLARSDAIGVTYLQTTPSMWKILVSAGWHGRPTLRLGSAGEALPPALAEALLDRSPVLWNLYGPTETTVYSSMHAVVRGASPGSIGRAVDNTHLYLLDPDLQPVPLGVKGELYIGGDGVAKGYHGRPELTAERFLSDPFAGGAARMYKTGDVAFLQADGRVTYLGRRDHQVKIRGVRIELQEIEAALQRLPGVHLAAVKIFETERGDKELVAYFSGEAGVTPGDLRAGLRQILPEPMIPAHFLRLDTLPLLGSGKVDRQKLPDPSAARARSARSVVKPATPTEAVLARIFAEVIQIGEVGREDDFFELGGHSLLLTPLLLRLRGELQVTPSLRELFALSRVDRLAAAIDRWREERAQRTVTERRSHRKAIDPRAAAERSAFLRKDAELPADLAPKKGLTFAPRSRPEVIFLTGATGFVGTHFVSELLSRSTAEIRCLVRGKDPAEGKRRIAERMRFYGLWIEEPSFQAAWAARVRVVPGDIGAPRLAMSDDDYARAAREVDAIIHSAALVNFLYPYEALREANVEGLRHMIRFAFDTRIKPVHFVSTAAIWPMGPERTFLETDDIDHGMLLNLAYDEAKWVGERQLANAAARGLPVAVYRPGEVGGHSVTGQCVIDHFAVALFKGGIQLGAFPSLASDIDVTPADYVAKALVFLMLERDVLGRAFHLTNPKPESASKVYTWLRSRGYRFDELPFDDWRERLIDDPRFGDNALYPYLGILEDFHEDSLQLPTYDPRNAVAALEGSGITCAPVDGDLLGRYIDYLIRVGHVPRP
ncbi:MAG: amino acid adenylation domain-containing protein [Deltaproteobacteria bacterium]|nr:amino acid adenylation domain-containing protein [Deltaproteobacteria bacterium]